MNRLFATFLGLAVAGSCHLACGALIPFGPHGGLNTFLDTNTNRAWVKLDTFFDKSYNEMSAVVTAAGFNVASRTDVQELLDTLPLSGGEWVGYASVMGQALYRNLIWGAYSSSDPTRIGWAYAYDSDAWWGYADYVWSATTVPNGGIPEADMNLWAFRAVPEPSTVPEPSSMLLMCCGAVGAAALGRLRRQTPVV